MSLPWSKVVRLRVGPLLACGTLEQGWPRRKVLARASASPVAQDGQSPQSRAAPVDALSSAIDAVLTELGKSATMRGARLEVEWANALMHFDVVAGDFAGDSDRQLQSVAVACVAELLGDAAEAHETRWQLQADGRHLLIGAIACEHLRLLSEAAAHHGMTLGGVQPDFCLQWNRHAAALNPGAAVFAVASEYEAVVTCVADGAVAAMGRGAWLDRSQLSGSAGLLDTRVDRLLASVGRDAASQSAFVLVAPELTDTNTSSRWTVLNREAPVA